MSTTKFGVTKLPIIWIMVAIVVGSLVYAKRWHQFIFDKKLTPITAAKLIPDEAIMSSFISTEINNWTKLQQLGLPTLDELFTQELAVIEGELTDVGISYQQDIQPWIGNIMIALVPTTNSSDVIQDFEPLIIIGIEAPFKAKNFLKKIQSQIEESTKKIEYKGLDITSSTDTRGNIVHTALLGNKLLASNKINAVKKSIDTFKGEASLSNSAKTKEIFRQKLELDNSLAQVYITNHDNLIANSLQDSRVPKNTIESLQVLQSLSFAIGTKDNKVKLQGLAKLDSQLVKQKYTNSPGQILTTLPTETIAFVSGQGINSLWTGLSEIANQEPELKTAFDGARTSTKFVTGLDLDQDIFGWMDGEFALGIVTSSQPNIPELNIGLGGAFALETSDRKTAQNTMDQLDNKIQQNLGIYSHKTNLKKADITQWSIPSSNLNLSSGWLDKNKLLFAFGSKDINSLYDSSKSSLKNNPKFQEIVQELPKKNLGYFYLDMETIMTEISPLLPRTDPNVDKVLSVLNSMTAIGGTITILDQETSQTNMVILFDK